MKHSDYSLIPILVAIVEEKNYSKAARRLGISQSAVSQSVVRLRDVFNDNLFIRSSHGVELTQFALDIYPLLSSAIENVSHTLPEHSKFKPLTCEKQFTVSSLSVFGHTILPELAVLIANEAPKASVKIELLYTNNMTDMLRSQYYDLAIDTHCDNYAHLRSQILMEDTLSVMCSNKHPRLTKDTITVEEYLQEKHVIHSQLDQTKGYLVGRGLKDEEVLQKRQIAWHTSTIMEVLPIIERTEYVALLPQKLVDLHHHNYDIKQLNSSFLVEPIKIAMYWHPSRTNDPVHKWFRYSVKAACDAFQQSL